MLRMEVLPWQFIIVQVGCCSGHKGIQLGPSRAVCVSHHCISTADDKNHEHVAIFWSVANGTSCVQAHQPLAQAVCVVQSKNAPAMHSKGPATLQYMHCNFNMGCRRLQSCTVQEQQLNCGRVPTQRMCEAGITHLRGYSDMPPCGCRSLLAQLNKARREMKSG
jgi:hypothetical protein